MAENRIVMYLADLTHTGQLIATNFHPLAIGLIAAYTKKRLGEAVEIELFRYPNDLKAALERRPPQILGFSNYSWNCNLAYQFTRRVKRRYPQTIVVFGGPNYGLSREEQQRFWRRYPSLDFYVVKEGEPATIELIDALVQYQFDVEALKSDGLILSNCHYLHDGQLVCGQLRERIKSLDEVPSPYLSGLMDKFFDNVLIPMTHTTRGCPFTCTFCTEGESYFNKVARRDNLDRWAEELEYIAQRVENIQDLIITDANFGMFREDVEKARVIARIQEKYGWPRHIHVSGGKNQKERLLEVASIINGAMNVAASLQSTDKQVLVNIKRSNISVEQLSQVGLQGSKMDANTYAEIILGLPGDSRVAHIQSLKDAVNAGLSFLRMYQLIMLYDTEMNTPETRKAFGMQTRFRVMSRCFGEYQIFDETFPCAETEEICVTQDSLSFKDYLECRELDLTVEIVHNAYLFKELVGLCKKLDFPWFDFLLRLHERRRTHGPGLKKLYDTFRKDNIRGLWESEEETQAYAEKHLAQYIANELGVNELFTAKAVAFFLVQDELREMLFQEAKTLIKERDNHDPVMSLYLDELKEFNRLRKGDLLDTEHCREGEFHFDFTAIMDQDFYVDPHQYFTDVLIPYRFEHSSQQKKAIQSYVHQYGTDVVGLGRILMRAHVKRLFRNVTAPGESVPTESLATTHELNL